MFELSTSGNFQTSLGTTLYSVSNVEDFFLNALVHTLFRKAYNIINEIYNKCLENTMWKNYSEGFTLIELKIYKYVKINQGIRFVQKLSVFERHNSSAESNKC